MGPLISLFWASGGVYPVADMGGGGKGAKGAKGTKGENKS